MRTLLVALSAVCIAGPAVAQEDASMDWLRGCWAGQVFGGDVTECWMVASDDVLVGSFMLVVDGELQFTEHLLIGEASGSQGYHVKHFTPDMVGWEAPDEMVTFPFLTVSENRIDWEGVSYAYDGDGVITVHLDLEEEDGTVETVVFSLTRME